MRLNHTGVFLVSACCAMAQTPSPQSSIAVRSLVDWPAAEESRIYQRDYAGLQINDDGSLSEYNGSDFVQLANPSVTNAYVDGLMGGSDIRMWTYGDFGSEDNYTNYLTFTNNNQSTLDDGRRIFLYPAHLVTDASGDYTIQPIPIDYENRHQYYGVRFSVNTGEVDPGHSPWVETPYDSLTNVDSYSYFIEDHDGSLRPYGNRIETYSRLVLTEDVMPLPPSDMTPEKYQFVSSCCGDVVSFSGTPDIRKQGRFTDVIVSDGSFYVRGLFPNTGDCWMRGVIDGDKVTFSRGCTVAAGSTISRLGVYSVEVKKMGSHDFSITATPESSDLIFKFDPSTHSLSGVNMAFMATCKPDEIVIYEGNADVPAPLPVFVDTQAKPFVDKPMKPSKPYILRSECYESQSLCFLEFMVSDISEEGDLMPQDKLYYEIKVGGETVEISPEQWPALESSTIDIPYDYTTYMLREDGDCICDGFWREWMFHGDYLANKTVEISLVYTGGGSKTVSDVCMGGDPNGIDDVEVSGDAMPAEVFDLQGVYVGSGVEGLDKGVYLVKRGSVTKKVFVK